MVNLRIFPDLDGVIGYDDGSLLLLEIYPTFGFDVGEPIMRATLFAMPMYGTKLSANAGMTATVFSEP